MNAGNMIGIATEINITIGITGTTETTETGVAKEITEITTKTSEDASLNKNQLKRKTLTTRDGVRSRKWGDQTLKKPSRWRTSCRSRWFSTRKRKSCRKLSKNLDRHVMHAKSRKINVVGQEGRPHHPCLLPSPQSQGEGHLELLLQGQQRQNQRYTYHQGCQKRQKQGSRLRWILQLRVCTESTSHEWLPLWT